MSFERGLDGLVGRMLSWLTLPPMRGVARIEERVAKKAPRRAATAKKAPRKAAAAKKTARKPAEIQKKAPGKKTAAKKAVTSPKTRAPAKRRASKKAAVAKKPPGKTASAKEDLDRFVEGAERVSGEAGDVEEKILEELGSSSKGLTLAQLQSRTGVKLADLRRHLKELQDSGRVQRGKGMGTRYDLG